jgi:hypothetical protein
MIVFIVVRHVPVPNMISGDIWIRQLLIFTKHRRIHVLKTLLNGQRCNLQSGDIFGWARAKALVNLRKFILNKRVGRLIRQTGAKKSLEMQSDQMLYPFGC